MRALKWVVATALGVAFQLVAAPIHVIAVEYPPFTTPKAPNGGLAFEMLQAAYPDVQFKPEWLPPKRAYRKLQNGPWCLSFYPAPDGTAATKISLSTNQVSIGLLRLRQPEPFHWQQMTELQGQSIAILRTGQDSKFARQFLDAGLEVIEIENIKQASELVLKQRVDLAIFDSYNFGKMPPQLQEKLQLSETFLVQTPIAIFLNPDCAAQLPALQPLVTF